MSVARSGRALFALAAIAAIAAAAPISTAAQEACDRACLDGMAKAYLDSLVSGDASILPLADDVRVTEDALEIAAGDGTWTLATGVKQHRLNLLDDDWSTAAGLAVMETDEGDALLAYRLLVEDGEITEIEQMIVEPAPADPSGDNQAMGRNAENLEVPREDFLRPVEPAEQNSRTELLTIAQTYPDGLKAGSFEAVNAPFPDHAERMENGMILAGPRCTFRENCTNMLTQSSPERPTLRQRNLAVDEQQGIVFMWLDWEQQATGRTLEVYEAFKIYGGQLHYVEAFMEYAPAGQFPGWDIPETPRTGE